MEQQDLKGGDQSQGIFGRVSDSSGTDRLPGGPEHRAKDSGVVLEEGAGSCLENGEGAVCSLSGLNFFLMNFAVSLDL